MAVRIGHASMDERGRANSGTAGDQTGKEVVIRSWYQKDWNVLLRPANATLAEKSAAACEAACANSNIGYDQYGRNSLYKMAKEKNFDLGAIDTPCECDCSSFLHVCAMAGGAKLTYGSNGHTTRTMVGEFTKSGDYIKLTGSEYLASDRLLKRGDILVKEGSHTVMVLDNGAGVAVETPPVITDPPADGAAIDGSVRLPLLRRGMRADTVKAMQQLLFAAGYDLPRTGIFEEITALALLQYQKDFNLTADGQCGKETWSALLGLTGVG